MPDDQRIIAADLIAFGDGNFYHERIVTPIFYVISYEIDHLSNLGVDVAHRLGWVACVVGLAPLLPYLECGLVTVGR